MSNNTNLTKEGALKLIKQQPIICPKCKMEKLIPRYTYKNQNVEYKCPNCKEIYHPTKLL
jgi:predicted RNA-binding Zn-ribbon protein involved in translation (DUF1610 family)